MDAQLNRAYRSHRGNARRRGIEWKFNRETWLSTWQQSGMLGRRGRGKDRYCMSRPGDVGPYSPENVRIVLFGDNVREAMALYWATDRPCIEQAQQEKKRFHAEYGITVLDWLKQCIRWHAQRACLLPKDDPKWPPVAGVYSPALPAEKAAA